ncbi:MAG: efflux RND transporter periplasmic adaptor subunit [Stellaceae bacterium]
MLPSPLSRASRALSRRAQLALLGTAALIALLLFVVVPALRSHFAPREAAAPVAPGTFRPTEAQWASLKIAPVGDIAFGAEPVADGKIALDDERTTPVFSPYSGRVTKLFAKLGDHVERGAPLMAVAAAELAQAQTEFVAAALALNKSRAQFARAVADEKRQHELYDAKAGAFKDVQQAQADLAAAQGNVRSAEIALAAARNRLRLLGKSDAEIAALENAPQTSAEAVVAAPVGGTVIQRQAELGQSIASASNGAAAPAFTIGDLSKVWLVGAVPEAEAPLMHLGAPVELRVPAYSGRVFAAKLVYVAPAVDPATHRLAVRAEVENTDGALKPEMVASFSIVTGGERSAPGVPQSAIIHEGDTARVWVVRPDHTLAPRSIRTGRTTADGMVEIVAGLEPGEEIVTSGAPLIDRAAHGG